MKILLLLQGLLWTTCRLVHGTPRITGIRYVGIGEGGSVLTINGEEFSVDQFNFFHPTLGNKVYLDNEVNTRTCNVIQYKTSSTQINCRVEPLGKLVKSRWYNVYLYVDGVLAEESGTNAIQYRHGGYDSNLFRYYITDFSPKSGPAGSIVTLQGSFPNLYYGEDPADPKSNKNKRLIESLRFGGNACNPKDENGDYYGFTDNEIKCKLDEAAVGDFLIEMGIESPTGVITPEKEFRRLSALNEQYNFQAYPVIKNVSPLTGSTQGMTTLTITGRGLKNGNDFAEVKVGGEVCKVVGGSSKEITCLTPPEGNHKQTIPGDRGLVYEVWDSYTPDLSDEVQMIILTASPATATRVVDGVDVPEEMYSGLSELTGRLSGYFVPPHDGEFAFNANSARINLYRLSGIVQNLILTVPFAYNDWSQSINRVTLSTKETYTIEVLHHFASGQHKSPMKVELVDYNSKNTDVSDDKKSFEKQEIKIVGQQQQEKQVIDFTAIVAADPVPDLTFTFVYNGQKSEPFTAQDLHTLNKDVRDSMRQKFLKMFSAKCEELTSNTGVDITEDFESSASWKGISNAVRTRETHPYCGERVGRVTGDAFLAFNNFDVSQTNWACFAYMGRFYTIKMYIEFTVRKKAATEGKEEWIDLLTPSENQDTWTYTCVNVMDKLKENYGDVLEENKPISAVKLLFQGHYNEQGNFIDSFSTSAKERRMKRTEPAGHGKTMLNWLGVGNKGPDTYELKIEGANCAGDFRLMGISLQDDDSPLPYSDDELLKNQKVVYNISGYEIPIERIQRSSAELRGTFDIIMGEKVVQGITADLNGVNMRNFLERDLEIWDLDVDRFDSCNKPRWEIAFKETPTDMPQIQIDHSNIQFAGQSLTSEAKTIRHGHIIEDYLGGSFFRVARPGAWVTVDVHGMPAQCAYGVACEFSYKDAKTPTVTDISHVVDENTGTVVFTITGTMFSEDLEDNVVTVDDIPCTITSATTTTVECLLVPGRAGSFPVLVRVKSLGSAINSEDLFRWDLKVDSVSPTEGSIGGGTVVSVAGRGFPAESWQDGGVISYSGRGCTILKASYTSFTCRMEPTNAVGQTVLDSSINLDGKMSFTFSDALTPTISSLSSTDVVGGDVLTILGSGFPDASNGESLTVSINDEECVVQEASTTEITCIVPTNPAGEYNILVMTDTGYAAPETEAKVTYRLTVTNIQPTTGSVMGGTVVTITGDGFGDNCSDVQVLLGDSYTCVISQCSNDEILCKTERISRDIMIENTGLHPIVGRKMVWEPVHAKAYPGDRVQWSWGIVSPKVKFSVTETATGFDDTPAVGGFRSGKATSQGTFTKIFTTLGDVYYVSPERHDFYSPRGHVNVVLPEDGSMDIRITKPGVTQENSGVSFSVSAAVTPIVDSLSVEVPLSNNPGISSVQQGSKLIVQGSNLSNAIIKLGDASCDVTHNTDTLVNCHLANLEELVALKAYDVSVSTNDGGDAALNLQKSTNGKLSLTPFIDDYEPKIGSEKGGFIVTITGSGFILPDDEKPEVWIGNSLCAIESYTYSQIKCIGSSGTGKRPLKVTSSTEAGLYQFPVADIDNSFHFSDGPLPDIESVSSEVQNDGSILLTITGQGFANDVSSVTVLLIENEGNRKRSIDTLPVSAPATAPASASCSVLPEGHFISAGSSPRPCKTSHSALEMEVVEVYFQECLSPVPEDLREQCQKDSSSEGCEDLASPKQCRVLRSSEEEPKKRRKRAVGSDVVAHECTVVQASDSSIKCRGSSIPAGDYAIKLVQNNFGLATGVSTVALNPMVASVEPSQGSIHGGTTVVITGSGFSADVSVSLGNTDCDVTDVQTNAITCVTPPNSAGQVDVVITSDGRSSDPIQAYEYSTADSPDLTSLDPSTGDIGETFTIVSTVPDNNAITVTMGGIECTSSDANTYEVPTLAAGSHDVVIQADPAGSSNTLQFQIPLKVSSMNPSTSGFSGTIATIDGSAFGTDEPPSVTVCGEKCKIQGSSSSDTIVCRVPPHVPGDTSTLECTVTVTLASGESANLASKFIYDMALSSDVSDISPKRGGTAGGTVLTITGSGFANSGNKVNIAGSECVIQTESSSSITCVTSEHSGVIKARVQVAVPGKGLSLVDENGEFYYVDRWSSRFSWGGGPLPAEGQLVVIEKDVTILLDQSTPVFKVLLIKGGTLMFDHEQSGIELNAEAILITDGGSLQIGTEDEPFENEATIMLHGNTQSTELPIYGAKVIAVREGTLDLHGKYIPMTWTYLAETAVAGSKVIRLKHGVTWNSGDRIAIATTSHRHSQGENEDHEIESVSSDGLTVTLKTALKFEHKSISQTLGGVEVETRAEVGLLTRNVKVRGNVNEDYLYDIEACEKEFKSGQFSGQSCFNGRYGAEQGSDMFGATIMMAPKDRNSGLVIGRFSYVEVTWAGQAFRLGRYPIHYHMIGDIEGSYVRGCAIHHTFNRAITIHTANKLLVEHNVVYNNMGHAIFTEDGIEENNIIQYNLAIYTRTSSSLLNVDVTPSSFWLVHPNNIVRHNAAAGGTHFGFWYRLDKHPGGLSPTTEVCQNHAPLGEFHNNTAHSCGWYGLWIFSNAGYYPARDNYCNYKYSNRATATFGKFTVWNCERGAEMVKGGAIQFKDFTVLDTTVAGLEFVETQGDWGNKGPGIYNALIVARSEIGTGECMERGIVTPQKERLSVDTVKFVNFDGDCAAVGACSQCGSFTGGFTMQFQNIQYENSPNKVYWQWEHEGVFIDADGSFTGNGPESKVLPQMALLPPEKCNFNVSGFSVNPEFPGAVCNSDVLLMRMDLGLSTPKSLLYRSMKFTNKHGSVAIPFLDKRITRNNGYMADLVIGENYQVAFEDGSQITNISYSSTFFQIDRDYHLWISHKFTQTPDHFKTHRSSIEIPGNIPDPATDYFGDWHWEEDTKTMTYLVTRDYRKEKRAFDNRRTGYTKTINLDVYRCYYDGCVLPPEPTPVENIEAKWSENRAWEHTPAGYGGNNGDGTYSPPSPNTDIFIGPQTHIKVDVQLPTLNKIFLLGTLEIEDTQDNVLSATHIIIQGGRLIVGSDDSPFQHKFKILLRGDIHTPDYPLPNGLNLGAKALGVFGEIDMHGVDVGRSWTSLGQTADKGAGKLILSEAVTWPVGAEVIVSTSSYEAKEAERAKITAVSDDGLTLTLDSTLQYKHLGVSHTLTDDSFTYKIAAKVGLLSRNLVIEGEDYAGMMNDSFGGRVIVGETNNGDTNYIGQGRFSNVEFKNMGQEGFVESYDPRFSLAFWYTGTSTNDTLSYVKKCAFNYNFNTAIGLIGSNSLTISDNVVYHTVGSSMKDEAADNVWNHNLVVLMVFDGLYNGRNEESNLRYDAGFEVQKATGVVLQDNCVAGSEKIGYHMDGLTCESSAPRRENEAHGCMHGVHLLNGDGHWPCTKIDGMFLWKSWDYCIFFHFSPSVEITGTTFVDCNVGVLPLISGPSTSSHKIQSKYLSVSDCVFVGRDPSFSCTDDVAPDMAAYRGVERSPTTPTDGKTGLMWGNFVSGGTLGPNMAWQDPGGGFTLRGETRINNVKFSNYGTSSCDGQIDLAMSTNPANDDGHHTIKVSNVVYLDTSHEGKLYVHRPALGRVNPSDCVDMDCDGQKKILILDLDGSIIDDGQSGTLIAQSEFEWDGDRRRGLGDYRIPLPVITRKNGSKILVDDMSPHRGIYGHDSCTWHSDWQMYSCHGIEHRQMIIESLDGDSTIRRLSPVALLIDRGPNGYIDLINGPQDFGWCKGYTCQERRSNFLTVAARNKVHEVTLTSTPPAELRFHLLTVEEDEAIIVKMWFPKQQQFDVYYGDTLVNPKNADYSSGKLKYLLPDPNNPEEYYPTLDSEINGENYYERQTGFVHFLLRGSTPITIRTVPKVVLSTGFIITEVEFFKENIIQNLADFFGLDESQIIITNIISESKKRRANAIQVYGVIVEFEVGAKKGKKGKKKKFRIKRKEALAAAEKIVDGYQKGVLSEAVKADDVTGLGVVEPREAPPEEVPPVNRDDIVEPEPGQKTIAEIQLEEALAAQKKDSQQVTLEVPSAMYIAGNATNGIESALTRGIIEEISVFIANKDKQPIQAGLPEMPWTVKASLDSPQGIAQLIGQLEVPTSLGWASFTNLAVTHAESDLHITFSVSRPNSSSLSVTTAVFSVHDPVVNIGTTGPYFAYAGQQFVLDVFLIDLTTMTQIEAEQQGYMWMCILTPASGVDSVTGSLSAVIHPYTSKASFFLSPSMNADFVNGLSLTIDCDPSPSDLMSLQYKYGPITVLEQESELIEFKEDVVEAHVYLTMTGSMLNVDFNQFRANAIQNLSSNSTTQWAMMEYDLEKGVGNEFTLGVQLLGNPEDIVSEFGCLYHGYGAQQDKPGEVSVGEESFKVLTATFDRWIGAELPPPDVADSPCISQKRKYAVNIYIYVQKGLGLEPEVHVEVGDDPNRPLIS